MMTVIIALDLLGRGEGSVGYLHASWAVGALLAGGALAMLYRRGNVTAGLAVGCLLTSSALAVPGIWPELVVAYLSFLLIGFGYASVKVTANVSSGWEMPETLARAIAYLETNRFVALAAGSLAGPALVRSASALLCSPSASFWQGWRSLAGRRCGRSRSAPPSLNVTTRSCTEIRSSPRSPSTRSRESRTP